MLGISTWSINLAANPNRSCQVRSKTIHLSGNFCRLARPSYLFSVILKIADHSKCVSSKAPAGNCSIRRKSLYRDDLTGPPILDVQHQALLKHA
jgi:hypothetical protein